MLLKKILNGSQMTKNSKIVFLTDLIEQRLRKESEISYFEKQLHLNVILSLLAGYFLFKQKNQ